MPRASIGIDGGKQGGVVVQAGGQLLAAAAWRYVTRGGSRQLEVRIVDGEGRLMERAVLQVAGAAVGCQIHRRVAPLCGPPGWTLCVEDIYVNMRNPKSSVELAKFTGSLAGPFELASRQTMWATASVWRSKVLGLAPRTPSATAKREALTVMPQRVVGLTQALNSLWGADHVADAAGLSVYGEITRSSALAG